MIRRVILAVCLPVAIAAAADTLREPLSNDDVLRLVKAGFGEAIVVQAIGMNAGRFDVTSDAVADLKRAGVADSVIAAMRTAGAKTPPHLRLLDPGVYYKRSDSYGLVEPDVVTWKSAVSKVGDLERATLVGQTDNRTSRLSLTNRGELLIVCNSASTASAYQLLRAEERSAWREFRIEAALSNGRLIGFASADRTAASVDRDQTFDLGVRIPLASLKPGEYGLVSPDLIANGRIYTFSIE